ncbi:protein phosphatase 2C domain-containing protein [Catenulispora sp. NF23]|uniref:protein phosphatase 2C domain-containing protein n=1 Tax=Catenulispora pinistramenti TaxID=2705254 RepID=UPI001BA8B5E0|nr:protein phosphatase 2C domain-containing protein [Catenulispora pinistramenti]MBS2539109.1 protein phosphatase 2C domain-containing protein [Catenulispora pinistramenti]
MEVSYVCQAASAPRPNDDFVIATESFVIVLDGATAPVGVDSGCVHDVPWLVARLGANLAGLLLREPRAALVDVLRGGIAATMGEHADTCDLENPDSPSSTAVMLRCGAQTVDYIVLGDSAIVIERGVGASASASASATELTVAHDNRTAHLPDYSVGGVSRLRNTDEGFWIASNRPEAADKAIVGSIPIGDVTRAALMTDGITRLVERYGRTWLEVLERMDKYGPREVVADVRGEELATPSGSYRGKVHDDVTAVFCRF